MKFSTAGVTFGSAVAPRAGVVSGAGLVSMAVAAACLLGASSLRAQSGAVPTGPDSARGAGDGALRVLDVPYLPQTPELCGGAAAAMVMRYWGHGEIEPEAFGHLVRPVAGGIRTGELADEVRARGWRAEPLPPDLDAVRRHVRDGRPVILLLRVAPERFHYVVAVATAEASWLIHDPARAPYQRLSTAELVERWGPAERWALVVVPEGPPPPGAAADAPPTVSGESEAAPRDPEAGPEGDEPAPRDAEADPPGGAVTAGDGEAAGGRSRCRETTRRGVSAARRGDEARADSLLRRAARGCPRAPAPRRELAGLRVQQGRWDRAGRLAREALDRAPGDTLALRILASSRFVAGRERAALAAWNQLGEPALSGIRVYGLRRTRYRPLRRQLGMDAGTLLGPADLALARRRTGAVPAFASARVDLRPPEGGRAEVDVAVLERPLLPAPGPGLAAAGTRALTERELRVRAASVTGDGELWTASWRWWERRPRVELRLAVPGAFDAPGVWRVRGSWERASFAAGPSTSDAEVREERRGGGIAVSRWVSPALRLEAGAGFERWNGIGGRARLSGEAELRGSDDRLAARLGLSGWFGSDRAFGRSALAAAARGRLPGGLEVRTDASLEAVGAAAPRTIWPGAGTGHARRPLLRAHPLLQDGVIRGPAFGRQLARAGLEARWAPPTGLPLGLTVAAFLDAAAAADRGPGRPDRGLVDGGVGLRLGLPGVGGELRVDAGWGLTDGESALSAGWRPPWPSW